MGLVDWLIVVIPTLLVVWIGIYSKKYIRSVVDFLSAGRVAGRYVISVGDAANALAIITLVAYIEQQYQVGFALTFWSNLTLPLGIVLSLFGFCTYRFRETKAMSLGQFLEMRYNRPFRIFAASLRSLSEMLANMIMPAIAARFFIYYLDLPLSVNIFGFDVSMFAIIVFLCLTVAITIICCGGTLALLVTDSIQGMILFPLMVVFVIFVLVKFNWNTEIVPVMMDRAPGESFLNPFDISELRDFNLLTVVIALFVTIFHRASWIGAGYSTAAKTPHEQKMAGLLGTLRNSLNVLFYALVAICIIVVMNHGRFAKDSYEIKQDLSSHITEELVQADHQEDFMSAIASVPVQNHKIGVDAPLSQEQNLDTPLLDQALVKFKEYNGESQGNAKFQQFRTLYFQLMSASSMRNILPPVMIGLFALLLVLAMISTDDSRIFSASLTITQDVIMPLKKKPFTPSQHIIALRLVSIGVGVFFLCGSFMMSQLDYINLFVTIMTMMWLGGCAPVMIFGLYSRFGNAAGAFASLVSGMLLSFTSIILQRNWADFFYPLIEDKGWHIPIGNALEKISSPFNPYIVWKMDAIKFPINAYELYFFTMIFTLIVYCAVSLLTYKKPFNIDRMLHRGIYNLDNENKEIEKWTLRNFFSKLIGITPDYTKSDKVIAWSVFAYSFIFQFIISIICVIIWNTVTPWTIEWWGHYFLITSIIVPGIIATILSVWFTVGGSVDLFRLFRDLEQRVVNPLDNGAVDGEVSLAEKEVFAKLEKEEK